jgi:hypothetical protein
MVRLSAALLLLLLCSCGDGPAPAPGPAMPAPAPLVDLGDAPVPIALGEAPAIVTPPPGRWQRRMEPLADRQWFVEYRSEDGRRLLRAFVFPTQSTTDPVVVLLQAVDTFFRSVGVEGFGLPTRRARSVWGAPAADASLNAVVGVVPVDGAARLVLVRPDLWAFAVGYVPKEAPIGEKDVVDRFVQSLEPVEPRFHEPTFRNEAELARAVLEVGDETPLRGRDLAAILLLLEAGSGIRLPLASRATLGGILVEVARALTPEGRAGYRDATQAFPTWDELPAAEREQGMRQLGVRMLQGLFTRANEGDARAHQFATAWQYLQGTAIGDGAEGLTVGSLGALNEISAFLASLAADEDIARDPGAGSDLRLRLQAQLKARWGELPAEERAALRATDAQWARLRRAFDLATAAERAAFRRAVVAELAAPEDADAVSALDPGRPLMAWIDEHRTPERAAQLMERAFALSPGQREELIGLLGVDPQPYALGW